MRRTECFDTLSVAAVVIGLTQGVAPFIAKAFGWTPIWALPRHFAPPWSWIVSAVVTVTVVALLAILDSATGTAPTADPTRRADEPESPPAQA